MNVPGRPPTKRPEDPPLPPLDLRCVVCEGQPGGCEACNWTGTMAITGCPREQAAEAMWALDAHRWQNKGAWPMPGGWMDQTAACLAAVDMVEREQRSWKRRQLDD